MLLLYFCIAVSVKLFSTCMSANCSSKPSIKLRLLYHVCTVFLKSNALCCNFGGLPSNFTSNLLIAAILCLLTADVVCEPGTCCGGYGADGLNGGGCELSGGCCI